MAGFSGNKPPSLPNDTMPSSGMNAVKAPGDTTAKMPGMKGSQKPKKTPRAVGAKGFAGRALGNHFPNT